MTWTTGGPDPVIAGYHDRTAVISRWVSALDGLARHLRPDYFTTAYFHPPEELAGEVAAAGLALQGVYAVEGPGWILSHVAESLLGASAHLLALARRPS